MGRTLTPRWPSGPSPGFDSPTPTLARQARSTLACSAPGAFRCPTPLLYVLLKVDTTSNEMQNGSPSPCHSIWDMSETPNGERRPSSPVEVRLPSPSWWEPRPGLRWCLLVRSECPILRSPDTYTSSWEVLAATPPPRSFPGTRVAYSGPACTGFLGPRLGHRPWFSSPCRSFPSPAWAQVMSYMSTCPLGTTAGAGVLCGEWREAFLPLCCLLGLPRVFSHPALCLLARRGSGWGMRQPACVLGRLSLQAKCLQCCDRR